VLYLLWALTPDHILVAHAIDYYPSKYWAVALPTWFCVTIVFVYGVYQRYIVFRSLFFAPAAVADPHRRPSLSPRSLNMIHTLSPAELEKTYNSTDPVLLEKRFFSRPGDAALLPLVELPPAVVDAVLRDGQDPLGG
jgi:hypothetical protein